MRTAFTRAARHTSDRRSHDAFTPLCGLSAGTSGQLFRLHQGRPLDARLFAPELSSGDLRLDSSPKGDPAEALAGLAALAPAAPLLVQLEPETWSAWAPGIAALHRPVVVTGPLGGTACEVDQNTSALAGCPALQAHPLFFSDGLLSVMALARQGRFEGLRKFRLSFDVPLDGALEQAVRSKEAYDGVLWHVLAALQFAAELGVPVAELRVANEVDLRYWRNLELACTAPVDVRITIGVQRGADDGGRLEIEAARGELLWQRGAEMEKVVLTADGRRAAREIPRRPWEEALLAGLPDILAAPGEPYAAISGQARVYEHAADLADQYLHGNARALSRLRAHQRTADLTAPGAPFEGFAVTAQPGFDIAFVADESRSFSLAKRLARPQRVLLLRAPIMTRMAMYELFPSLALAQLNAAAAMVGADVQCIDLAPSYVADPESAGDELDVARYRRMLAALRAQLAEDHYDLVAISLEDPKAWPLMKLALTDLLRGVAHKVVVGGRGAGMIEHAFMGEALVDYVIFGEGDLALIRLLHHLSGDLPEHHVPGLWNPAWDLRERIPPLLPDFNFLPTPDFTGMDLSLYNSTKPALPVPFLPYLFVLGCPYRCAFCANDSAQKGRYRSGERTAHDLRTLRDRHGVNNFYFLNNLTNNNPVAFEDFLQFMEREDLDLNWVDCARPYGISDDQFVRLRKVGCRELTFGIDTGSQRLSNLMRKGYKIAKAVETAQRAHDHGISVVINLIVGMPHETEQDFAETVRFIEELRPFVRSFSVSPYMYTPGSPLHDSPREFAVRRKGDVFDEVNGLNWRDHLKARARRYYTVLSLIDDQKSRMYMPGFEEYHDLAGAEC